MSLLEDEGWTDVTDACEFHDGEFGVPLLRHHGTAILVVNLLNGYKLRKVTLMDTMGVPAEAYIVEQRT